MLAQRKLEALKQSALETVRAETELRPQAAPAKPIPTETKREPAKDFQPQVSKKQESPQSEERILKREYEEYRLNVVAKNKERQKAGQSLFYIKKYEEWLKGRKSA